jgi:hypothetical protein
MSKNIYKQITWNWDKDLLNHNISIDWLRDIEHENRVMNLLSYDKQARYLQDLLLQKIEFSLHDKDDCIEILFTENFDDIRPKGFSEWEYEDCEKFVDKFIKKPNKEKNE